MAHVRRVYGPYVHLALLHLQTQDARSAVDLMQEVRLHVCLCVCVCVCVCVRACVCCNRFDIPIVWYTDASTSAAQTTYANRL